MTSAAMMDAAIRQADIPGRLPISISIAAAACFSGAKIARAALPTEFNSEFCRTNAAAEEAMSSGRMERFRQKWRERTRRAAGPKNIGERGNNSRRAQKRL